MNEQLQRLMALAQTDAALRLLGECLGDLEAEEQRLRARLSQNEEELRARQEAHRKLRSQALAKMNVVDATEEKIRLYQHKLDHEIIP